MGKPRRSRLVTYLCGVISLVLFYSTFQPNKFFDEFKNETMLSRSKSNQNVNSQGLLFDSDYGMRLEPVTAVLLNWKRTKNLQKIVVYLNQFNFVKQIVIWNNNPDVALREKDFLSTIPIQVYNIPANVQDLGKYLACSLSKYETCYLQDDDWLNIYMKSLYLNFLMGRIEMWDGKGENWMTRDMAEPNKNKAIVDGIWTATIPEIHVEHQRWRFYNSANNLHAGFTWLGTGSFISKSLAKRFLKQVGQLPEHFSSSRLYTVDMYFSLFSNTYPYQLVTKLNPLNQSNGWSDRTDAWDILFDNMQSAAKIVHQDIFKRGNSSIFSQTAIPFSSSSYARAPCHNDQCLFYTSISNFPPPELTIYNPLEITNISYLDIKQYNIGYPNIEVFRNSNYWRAVDGDPKTCWTVDKVKTFTNHDFVAIQFIKPIPIEELAVFSQSKFLASHSQFYISSQPRPSSWKPCSMSESSQKFRDRTPGYQIQSRCESSHGDKVRWVKMQIMNFSSEGNVDDGISVCGIKIVGGGVQMLL